jgi:hypothetical protein
VLFHLWLWNIFSEDNIIKMITTGLPTLTIAILSPFIVVKLALKQFYSQKWWETKAASYSKILEHISNFKYALEQRFDHDVVNSINLSEQALLKYRDFSSQAYDEIRKVSAMGSRF